MRQLEVSVDQIRIEAAVRLIGTGKVKGQTISSEQKAGLTATDKGKNVRSARGASKCSSPLFCLTSPTSLIYASARCCRFASLFGSRCG